MKTTKKKATKKPQTAKEQLETLRRRIWLLRQEWKGEWAGLELRGPAHYRTEGEHTAECNVLINCAMRLDSLCFWKD